MGLRLGNVYLRGCSFVLTQVLKMQSFSRRVDYSSGVKPKKRYTMSLSGQPGEEEGQRVVENQQFRDF